MATAQTTATAHDWSSPAARRRVARRYAADRRLQVYGIAAIALAMVLLGTLFMSLIYTGYVAFYTTKVVLNVHLDAKVIDKSKIGEANYRRLVRNAFFSYFPDAKSPRDKRKLAKIMSSGASTIARNYAIANPDKIGSTVAIRVPLSDPYDQLYKGVIPRQIDALGPDRIQLFKRLKAKGVVSLENETSVVSVEAFIDPALIDPSDLNAADYQEISNRAFKSHFPKQLTPAYKEILARNAPEHVKRLVQASPSVIGQTVTVKLPLSEYYDALNRLGEAKMRNPRFSSDAELGWFDSLQKRNLLTSTFTHELFLNADSRFPELAGLAGALTGSFLALVVCFLLSFPLGIATAIYLEEFAEKSRWADLIEVNINNLAAVPSVVFGLLGLALFLNTFGLPRSVPLVGGMVLALMTLPTIIVATRAALKSVPPSIREAALGVGASKHQMVTHHVLPPAMPGILTGTIIGLAQALGETAPLLLIGMNAFVPSIENLGILQPSMALPTQIFSWADSPERGFVSRTSAAILILLGFLIFINALAVYLRQRFERKW